MRRRGFTLIEALLVISIGTVLLASGTVLYAQYRQTVSESAAMEKVVAFQSLIESMMASNADTYPTRDRVEAGWHDKRPQDWNMSPWGGNAAVAGVAGAISGPAVGQTTGTVVPDANDSGCLHYYNALTPRDAITAVDSTGNQQTTVSYGKYLIAIVPPARPAVFYFVRGGRAATDSLTGTVGDAAAPSDPW